MLIVISPAKKLDFDSPASTQQYTVPEFLPESKRLIKVLRQLSTDDVSGLMKLSEKLAELNVKRYAAWQPPFSLENAKQAVLAFKGDVYLELKADQFGKRDLQFAQKHLRILSGLHGLLRPLDLIQPYRLEMGSRLTVNTSQNLYAFWGDKITNTINKNMRSLKDKTLINLASNEYSRAIQVQRLEADLVSPVFKERKGDQYRVIGLLAKRARGMMSRYIIENHLSDVKDIKVFNAQGYRFSSALSTDNEWVFTRESKAAA